MPVVGIRELSRNTSAVIRELERTGEPVVVTREGRPIGALVPVDQDRLEDLVLAMAPELTWRRDATDEVATRPLAEVARERGVDVSDLADSGDASQLTEWARVAAMREFAPLNAVLAPTVVERMTADAASEVGDITQRAVNAVGEGEVPADAVERITHLNMSLLGLFVRPQLMRALYASPEEVESTIARTLHEAAEEVSVINSDIAGSETPSVTIYETALRRVDAACRRIGETDMGLGLR